MPDFKGFIAAYFSDWVGWMSGIASILLTLAGFLRKNNEVTQRAFWVAAALCFIIAAAHVWTIEHRKYMETVELLNNSYPKLLAHLDAVFTADISSENWPKTGMVYLVVSIENSGGSDSTVKLLQLYADVKDKGRIRGRPIMPTDPFRFPQGTLDTSRETMLAEKVAENPIPRGGLRRGWMVFYFPQLTSKELSSGELELVFQDVRGVQYSAVRDRSNPLEASAPVYYPGTGGLMPGTK